jgi:hypothetical protein
MQASSMRAGSKKVMLESWVNEVLAQDALKSPTPAASNPSSGRGAAHYGVARQQLQAAGLSATATDQLYRCLFVYSAGFADTVRVSRSALAGWLSEVRACAAGRDALVVL